MPQAMHGYCARQAHRVSRSSLARLYGTKSLGLGARSLIDMAVLTGVFELIVWVWRPANWQLAMVLGREVGSACVTITDVVCRRS